MIIDPKIVRQALNDTIKELISIDLGEENASSTVPSCDVGAVTEELTKHLQKYIDAYEWHDDIGDDETLDMHKKIMRGE